MMLRAALVAEPALRRVEPVMTSGPVERKMTRVSESEAGTGEHVRRARVGREGSEAAQSSAPRTKGVVPPAAMPRRASRLVRERAVSSGSAPAGLSSRPSLERRSAGSPPAMMPMTRSGEVQKVGGHSEASRTPRRPLVPAPR